MSKVSNQTAITPTEILKKYDSKLTQQQKKLLEDTKQDFFFVFEKEGGSIEISEKAPTYKPDMQTSSWFETPNNTNPKETIYESKINKTTHSGETIYESKINKK